MSIQYRYIVHSIENTQARNSTCLEMSGEDKYVHRLVENKTLSLWTKLTEEFLFNSIL